MAEVAGCVVTTEDRGPRDRGPEIEVELFSHRTAGGRLDPTAQWVSEGLFTESVMTSLRMASVTMVLRGRGDTFIALTVEARRYRGKCRGCKRTVTALLRETAKVGHDGRGFVVKRTPKDLWRLNEDASLVECPDCGKGVRLAPLSKVKVVPGHRCDARCTGAKGADCECSCGGVNHGADWGI